MGKIKFSEIKDKIRNNRGFNSIKEIKEAGLRVVKTKNGDYWLIEEEYLKPVIKSPRELKTIVVREEDLKYKVLMCHKSRTELKREDAFVLDYIKWGEKMGFNKRPTCRSRKRWWELPERLSFIISKRFIDEKFTFFINVRNFFVGDTFFIIEARKKQEKLALYLNTSLNFFLLECFGRKNMGQGVLLIYGPEIKPSLILTKFEYKNSFLLNKKINSIFTELGFDPSKPIREQEPNPLPDRKALDDIVFDALGLTEEERKEVYWSVAELVKSRLDKARSFKK